MIKICVFLFGLVNLVFRTNNVSIIIIISLAQQRSTVVAYSSSNRHVSKFCAAAIQLLTLIDLTSTATQSAHCSLGLPILRKPNRCSFRIFLLILISQTSLEGTLSSIRALYSSFRSML